MRNEFIDMKSKYNRMFDVNRYLITDTEVLEFIKGLKKGKAPGLDHPTADHLSNAHPIVAQLLTKLFNLMLLYEYVPDAFGRGILIPIPKSDAGKGDAHMDNYRGISLNPIISKLFEKCLLALFKEFLCSSSMQFRFKAKTGCTHTIYTVRKTIEYFAERQTTVNVCGLDMAKAFDRMSRYGLFIKLMKRGCPSMLINVLECWFAKVSACVRWGECTSDFVLLSRGTRQGGVASPILFAVCVDDILTKLQQSKLGCHIHFICFNSLLYADDLLLLTLSVEDMQKMINICKDELNWLDMKINVRKSECIRIGPRYNVTCARLRIDNESIEWGESLSYLGIVIKSAKNFKCCFHEKKIKFYRSINGILGKLGSDPPINVTLSLVSSNCVPVLLYGLEALMLNKADTNTLSYPYNSVFMKLFKSFNKNIITLCQYYCGELPLEYLLHSRNLNFYSKLNMAESSPASVLYRVTHKFVFKVVSLKTTK